MARELPEVYRQVSIEHYEAKRLANVGLGRGTHYDAIENTLILASQLRESFKKYETKRNEINSFHQLVDGIEMDVDDAIRAGQALTMQQQLNSQPGGALVELNSAESIGDDYLSVKHLKANANGGGNDYESTI